VSATPEHFDAVVVGSGFGGAVTAYRLAEGGLRVCLLERGKAYPPGSFPRIPYDMARNFWDPSDGRHGMFDLWTFKGLEALVSSGLGGGSLIYANVLLRKDPEWFVSEEGEDWPVTRADLDPHYDRVEPMLAPQRYPFDTPPYSETPKTLAMQEAAGKLGLDWDLPPLGVTFANGGRPPRPGEPIVDGENLHALPRFTCRLCGECDIGCNFGSKNSLDYNYLTQFARLGGDIRTRSEVRSFARATGGFEIHYVTHTPEREGHETDTAALPVTTLTAKRLVLSAGALGTTYLLLRNADALPGLARAALGTRFCGNGDLLGFITRGVRTEGGRRRGLDPSVGPVITSRIRYADQRDGDGGRGRGFYIEEGGYPQFASWLVEMTEVSGRPRRALKFAYRRVKNLLVDRPVSNVSGEVSELLGDCVKSSGALPLLGMGRDVPDGNMRLRDGFLEVDWTTKTSRAYFDAVKAAMQDLAGALGARFNDSPLWYFRRVVTVHPLGGCPMARTPEQGVVDAHGQVFGVPGLSIADGSVMPGPVGPNPSLTIAALADRFADRIMEHDGK
jgi:cholesterol oxidase